MENRADDPHNRVMEHNFTFTADLDPSFAEELFRTPTFQIEFENILIGVNGRMNENTNKVTFDWTEEGLALMKRKASER